MRDKKTYQSQCQNLNCSASLLQWDYEIEDNFDRISFSKNNPYDAGVWKIAPEDGKGKCHAYFS